MPDPTNPPDRTAYDPGTFVRPTGNPLNLTDRQIKLLRFHLPSAGASEGILRAAADMHVLIDNELLRKVEGPGGYSGHEISEKGRAYLARYDGAPPAEPPTCCQKCGTTEVFLPQHGAPRGHGCKKCLSCGTYRPWPPGIGDALAAAAPPVARVLTADELAILAHANGGPRPSNVKFHGSQDLAAKLTSEGYIEGKRFALTDKGKAALAAVAPPPLVSVQYSTGEAPGEPQERVIEVKQQISPTQIVYLRWLSHGIKDFERRQLADAGLVRIIGMEDTITTDGLELLASLDKQAAEEPPRAPSPTPAEVEALVAQAREEGRIAGLKEAAELLDRLTDGSRKRIRQMKLDLADERAVRDAYENGAARLWAKVDR